MLPKKELSSTELACDRPQTPDKAKFFVILLGLGHVNTPKAIETGSIAQSGKILQNLCMLLQCTGCEACVTTMEQSNAGLHLLQAYEICDHYYILPKDVAFEYRTKLLHPAPSTLALDTQSHRTMEKHQKLLVQDRKAGHGKAAA